MRTVNPNDYLDEYLESRLCEWAEWLRSGNQLGIGYPRRSILALIKEGKVITKNRQFCSVIETNDNAEEIENLVREMAQYKRVMAEALRNYYLDRLSLRRCARQFKISHMHYKLYIEMAKQWLIGRLSVKWKLNQTI